ncbi:MAG: GGDEF domain-containing protein [Eubacterium sp.]|nr:GGDEF domain-containing protein [Eubacterium sp.]
MIKEFLLQNWALLLILLAFAILLRTTAFLNKKTKTCMYGLIGGMFLLSIIVFFEFYLEEHWESTDARLVLIFIRYSATPFIIAFIIYTMAINIRWYVFIPAIALTIINFISLYNGMVFSLDEEGQLKRGVLGYLPYILVGVYSVLLVFILIRRSNKRSTEIFPILFLCFAFVSGLILPFALGKDFSKLFCVTIVIAVFVYHVFSILQLTEKDSLTGLLNRQAFYASIETDIKSITALVSIDMNGLKVINDTEGHAAGDKALVTIALCFLQAATSRQSVYRIGGDEFVILCRRATEDDVKALIARIRKHVSKTRYRCAVGYSYAPDGTDSIDDMLKESDEKMYADKAAFYAAKGN